MNQSQVNYLRKSLMTHVQNKVQQLETRLLPLLSNANFNYTDKIGYTWNRNCYPMRDTTSPVTILAKAFDKNDMAAHAGFLVAIKTANKFAKRFNAKVNAKNAPIHRAIKNLREEAEKMEQRIDLSMLTSDKGGAAFSALLADIQAMVARYKA